MKTLLYPEQIKHWPTNGKHVLGQYSESHIRVYQAYRPSIAEYAVKNQRFGGEFSYTRMSWIKPNFLWMMFRSGWGEKVGQERVLAILLQRNFFDELTEVAVASSFRASGEKREEQWRSKLATSDVRFQWDPDHDPSGASVDRRAIQLGLRGEMLHRYGKEAIVFIEDITDFVTTEKRKVISPFNELNLPTEEVYPLTPGGAKNLRADEYGK